MDKLKTKFISGIQQIGVGVPNLEESWKWYRKNFGMNIEMFNEKAVAELMLKYTEGQPIPRHAVLALNLNGGGGFEVWHSTVRKAQAPGFELKLGDYGMMVAKLKSTKVAELFEEMKKNGLNVISDLETDPSGKPTFYVKDPYNHIFQIVHVDYWFGQCKSLCGGAYGGYIGVSDIEAALPLYRGILKHDEMVYDQTGTFDDLKSLPGGEKKFRRVLLRNSQPRKGAFSKLLGDSEIELIQVLDRQANKVYKDRIWSDLGFIHLCFDITGMDLLKEECRQVGFPFTVDSANSFDMGVAAGRFAYIEDKDGMLIEFVETHKIPVLPKLGWYLNLQKRNVTKPLPDWLVKMQRFLRVKD